MYLLHPLVLVNSIIDSSVLYFLAKHVLKSIYKKTMNTQKKKMFGNVK